MKKNKGFYKGLIAGAVACIFGICLAGIILNHYYGYQIVILQEDDLFQVSSEVNQEDDEYTGAITDELIEKLKLFERYVDSQFLMEADNIEELQNGIYKGYMDALGDPYTCYYTEEEFAQLQESTSGTYSGIGVMVSQDVQTKSISVVKVFSGSPGEEAGLLPGDVITKVGDNEVAGTDMDLSTLVSYIKGEEGTNTTIQVYRESVGDYVDLEVTRRKIEVPTVEYEMLENSIGYIAVTEFDEVTAVQYIEAVEQLKTEGMEGLIVDIRDNPGGVLDIVVEMLDYMLPEGTIVYTEDKNGQGDVYTSDAENYFDLPLAVLVNGNSASASEIFAGAIKDYGVGTIIGTQTFGKGIVQHVYPLSDNTGLKITVSRYYTPQGTCIHGVGIEPDIEVDLQEELKTLITVPKDEDNQLQTAVSVIEEMIH